MTKVIYSAGFNLSRSGLGEIALNACHALSTNRSLDRLITLGIKNRDHFVTNKGVVTVLPNRVVTLGNGIAPTLGDTLFDFAACHYIIASDVYHGWSAQSLYSARRAKKLGLKTILDAGPHIRFKNKLIATEFSKIGLDRKHVPDIVEYKMAREVDEADYVIVPSRYAYDTCIQEGVPSEKLHIVPLGVNIEKYRPIREYSESFNILFVGHNFVRKGLRYLLEAWKSLEFDRAKLLIVGRMMLLQKKILELCMDRVRFTYLGYVQDLAHTYQRSSVLVLPSVSDGFGLVVLEAMACGLPVIVSENTGARDIVENGKNGFVVPIRSPNAIAECLTYLYENEDERKKMGRNARLTAERYSWRQYGKRLLKIYTNLE